MESKRIGAFFIDFVIVGFIQFNLMMVFLIIPLMNNVENDINFNIIGRQLAVTYCSMFFMVIKDIVGKKSIGKRILKLKIIDKNTGNEVNIAKRLVRNLTWLLGPIDIIVYLITKERFGDKIVNTQVVESIKNG